VPRKTNLRFHMGAGEVKVDGVVGDKDIDLYAGQISVSSPGGWTYKSVDASVDIGDVNASAFGVDKGGFFPQLFEDDGRWGVSAAGACADRGD